MVCKPFRKKLHAGLQFRVDLFASKLHPDVTGKGTSLPPTGCLFTDVTEIVLQQMHPERLLHTPGAGGGPGNTAVNKTATVPHQREFVEMELLLQRFGTS